MSRSSVRRESPRVCYHGPLPYTVCLSPTEDRSAFLVDIYETDGMLTIEGAAPGVRREDIEVTAARDVVMIHVRPRPAPRPRPGRCVRRERYAGGWSRTIELPMEVEPSALTWSVTRGSAHVAYPQARRVRACSATGDITKVKAIRRTLVAQTGLPQAQLRERSRQMLEWILVPVDIGERDARGIEIARQFAARADARIALVYVEGRDTSTQEKTRDTLTLRRLTEPLWDADVEAYYSVEVGRPAAAIADAAHELRPDLIIMAPPAHEGIDRLLHRSVTLAMLSRAPVPMLVWPPHLSTERAGSFLTAPASRIIVPLDGSDLAEGALPVALSFARDYSRPLVLARAVAPRVTREPSAAHAVREEHDEEMAIQYMTEARDRLAAEAPDVALEYSILYGKPEDAIVRMVGEADPGSLVVMSTHGRAGIEWALVGSVAAEVLHRVSIPVVVVPPLANTGWPDVTVERHEPEATSSETEEAKIAEA
jgi:nucleotide-binding universal stress UspA family protein/HSP20 family molecular chaperone IbpA